MDLFRRFLRNPLSLTGFIILLFFALVAALAPLIAPPQGPVGTSPYLIPRAGWGTIPLPPGPGHLFGTAEGQYDIFYGIVWGTRTAFGVGLAVVGASLIIGLVVGSVAGFFGGWLDELMMRVTDIFLAFPYLVAAVVVTTILGKGLDKVIIALILFGWMGYARLIRSSVLQVKEMEFVEAARALGQKTWKIILRHVLPNSIYPLLVQASMDIGSVVLTAAGLSFLGLGAETGFADWGQLVSFARNWIKGEPGAPFQYWYTVFWPSLAIVLFVLGWNLVGDGVRDVMDPRLRQGRNS
ncbi:MAG: ABC transporter permease [Firmicutes bacterium]|nr:ABC transporter permease [Bacillota bacterium]